MEERSLRIYNSEKTFFSKLTNTLTKIIVPTQIGINSVLISMKRNNVLKAYEGTLEDTENQEKKESAKKKNIQIHTNLNEAFIKANSRLIYEIIYNLIDNAIRYSNNDSSIEVSTYTDIHHAYLKVKDHGIGIPLEDQSRIFERFYRVDKSHSRATGGTGLGLSIVKHAVKLSHGTIALESELNKGSTFTVAFPKA